ncbi:phospholipase/carboxylesterase family protein [Corallococcus coralloides]|uniref:Phospholipase/carboxylesterase family protein n=1 Tax=Corallococcus coralloides TaxID=184914 RepID=A0A410RJX5_CORCK|nr:alpha/beta fold hydrolase [Corallococcus coralloides]QAT82169.1 phospholipase/carboxylesterase family protein [Corallococcus coralloides]
MRESRTAAVLLAVSMLGMGCAGNRGTPPVAPGPLVYKSEAVGAPKPEALLVALHFSGSTPAFWDAPIQSLGIPVRTLLPQGPRPRRDGFTWFQADHEEKTWEGKTGDVERMAERLAELIREVRAAHPELRRVVVTGFSYGGDLAWMLAIRHPELVDAAVPMGTRLLGDPGQEQRVARKVRVLQGEQDAIIPVRHTRERVAELKGRGVPIDVRTYPDLGHDVSPELLEDWRAFLRQSLQGRTD